MTSKCTYNVVMQSQQMTQVFAVVTQLLVSTMQELVDADRALKRGR